MERMEIDFFVAIRDRTRSNCLKLQQEKLRLKIRRDFLTLRVVRGRAHAFPQHWGRGPCCHRHCQATAHARMSMLSSTGQGGKGVVGQESWTKTAG